MFKLNIVLCAFHERAEKLDRSEPGFELKKSINDFHEI